MRGDRRTPLLHHHAATDYPGGVSDKRERQVAAGSMPLAAGFFARAPG